MRCLQLVEAPTPVTGPYVELPGVWQLICPVIGKLASLQIRCKAQSSRGTVVCAHVPVDLLNLAPPPPNQEIPPPIEIS